MGPEAARHALPGPLPLGPVAACTSLWHLWWSFQAHVGLGSGEEESVQSVCLLVLLGGSGPPRPRPRTCLALAVPSCLSANL